MYIFELNWKQNLMWVLISDVDKQKTHTCIPQYSKRLHCIAEVYLTSILELLKVVCRERKQLLGTTKICHLHLMKKKLKKLLLKGSVWFCDNWMHNPDYYWCFRVKTNKVGKGENLFIFHFLINTDAVNKNINNWD